MRHKSFYTTSTALTVCLIALLTVQQGFLAKRAWAAPQEESEESQDQGGQSLLGKDGSPFMEEVVTDAPKPKPKPIPIDLSRVGVSVDPHGNIVPLHDSPNDPWAASGVKPFYNHIETSTTAPFAYGLPYSPYQYGGFGYPRFGGYGGFGYPRFGGYGGFGYPRFGGYGYPAFNPLSYGGYPYGPLPPFGIGYATSGNSATFISNDPVTGAPIPQPQQSNSQTNVFNSNTTFSPGLGLLPGLNGGWIAPTTNYQQNSVWKAFNLGF